MPQLTGVCPDCTYPLTGLTEPRCPECGLRFHPRLLTEPDLARPRPAWERRPHVSWLRGAARTLLDVTFRPRRFLAGIQQPDRLASSFTWALGLLILTHLVVPAGTWFAATRWSGVPMSRVLVHALWEAAPHLQAWPLIGLLLLVLLLVSDLILWRDRARFRILVKFTAYGLAGYGWGALAIGTIWFFDSMLPDEILLHLDLYRWPTWIIAGAITWHLAIIYDGVLAPSFASLFRRDELRRGVLALLVFATWVAGMYFAFFDNHLGFRFGIEASAWTLMSSDPGTRCHAPRGQLADGLPGSHLYRLR